MKKSPFALVLLLLGQPWLSGPGVAQESSVAEAPIQEQKSMPADLSGLAELKLKRDNSALPQGGQLQMSYATVVENLLPSVVTIFPSTPIGGTDPHDFSAEDLERIPPNLRPFFYRFFGVPEDGEPRDPRDRRRGGQGQEQEAPRRDVPRQRGVGSGVIISADGHILTNNHVIEGADDIEVAIETNQIRKTYKAKVIGADPLTDVALIKIEAKGLKPAVIGDSDKLRVGDVVLAAGAPMELNLSVTQGIISALGRSRMNIVGGRRGAGYEDFIQTDAAINPGNSGGPLVDAMGRVIGINTAILSRSGMNGGIGFAIPVNMALGIVSDLLESGEVRRGFLGVAIQDVEPDQAEVLGLDDQGGALVTMVGGDSPAEKAGMEPEDVVISADGLRVDSSSRLRLIVSARKPGTVIPLEIVRNRQTITLDVELGELPPEAMASAGNIPRQREAAQRNELVKGMIVAELTADLRKEFGIPARVGGLVVVEVAPNSGPAKTGIQKGDVIQEVNRNAVSKYKEAANLVKESGAGIVRFRIYRDGDSMLAMVNVGED
jgi:serine protease Do